MADGHADIVYAVHPSPRRADTEDGGGIGGVAPHTQRPSASTVCVGLCAVVLMLCITTTLGLVAVQQDQVAVLDRRLKAMDARSAAAAERVDAQLARLLSKLATDVEDPMQYQTQLVEYTLQGIQESYVMTANLRDAILMLVTLLQSQIGTRAIHSRKVNLLNLTRTSPPGAWFLARQRRTDSF